MVWLWPAATSATSGVMEISDASGPEARSTTRVPSGEALLATSCSVDVLPISTLPKSSAAGENVAAAATPSPVAATASDCAAGSSAPMDTCAEAAPARTGRNSTVASAACPGCKRPPSGTKPCTSSWSGPDEPAPSSCTEAIPTSSRRTWRTASPCSATCPKSTALRSLASSPFAVSMPVLCPQPAPTAAATTTADLHLAHRAIRVPRAEH